MQRPTPTGGSNGAVPPPAVPAAVARPAATATVPTARPAAAGAGAGTGTARGRSSSATAQRWTRLAHVYTSMIALLVVLFFGVTGLTLNHPSWTLGLDATTSTETGTLPEGTVAADGTVEFLVVSEYLRTEYEARGTVTNYGVTGEEGFISYRGPGYLADVRFDTGDRSFELKVERQGFIGVMNDLHKGRDTNASWGWVIDVAAVFLVVIALSGLGLQLFLKRRRTAALVVAAAGTIATVIVAITTLA